MKAFFKEWAIPVLMILIIAFSAGLNIYRGYQDWKVKQAIIKMANKK